MAEQRYRDIVVIGGGCYGSFYAGQLAQARDRGKITFRTVILVDRNPDCQARREGKLAAGFELAVETWDGFLDHFLDRPPPAGEDSDDAIVPSPLMPHLMAHWLERVAAGLGAPVERAPADLPFGTPYDVLAPDGTRYVSFADWICPTHCIEPRLCPAIDGPRTWEMSEAVAAYVGAIARVRAAAGPAVFLTRHRTFGVGMFDVAAARRARDLLAEAVGRPGPVDFVAATVSSCHGAVTVLRTA